MDCSSIHICFFGWADHVHLERWAGYFASTGYQVSVISVSGVGEYPTGVRQYSLSGPGRYSYRLQRLYLRYLLWRINPDIVHVHWAGFLTNTHGLWSGPLAVTVWGSDIYKIGELPQRDREMILKGLQDADLITCDSADLASQIVQIADVQEDRISIIQWGVDTSVFSPKAKPSRLARELGIETRRVILSIRGFAPLYNLDKILLAFHKIRPRYPEAVLLMKKYNSDNEYETRLYDLISRLNLEDSVFVCDRVKYSEMADFYNSGEIAISVPDSDGTPMSMLEAMACGCGLILSDLPSIREWVNNGYNGFLVDPDENAIARAIADLVDDSEMASTFARRNLAIVETRASQSASMNKMNAKYRALAQD